MTVESFEDFLDKVRDVDNWAGMDKFVEFMETYDIAGYSILVLMIIIFVVMFFRLIKIRVRIEICGLAVEADIGILASIAAAFNMWLQGRVLAEQTKDWQI